MTTADTTAELNIRQLVDDFTRLHQVADPWADAEPEEGEDCDVLSNAFTAYCHERGVEAKTIRVRMHCAAEPMLDEHYFTVLGCGVAVDFTARQFHNVTGMPLTVLEIPFPLVFLWPGGYPLPKMTTIGSTDVEPESDGPDS